MNSTAVPERPWKDIALRTLKSNKVHVWLLWSLAAISTLYQISNANFVFVLAVVVSAVALLTGLLAADRRYYLQSDQNAWVWGNIKMAIGVTFLVSNFLYLSPFQAVIIGSGGTVRYWPGSLAITHFTPFVDDAYPYQHVLVERAECMREGMSFKVMAQLVIPFNALPVAHARIGSWRKVEEVAEKELCRVLDSEVLIRAIAEGMNPNTFFVEQKVLDERSDLNDYGIYYNGAVEVSDIHGYLVQTPN